VRRPQQRRRSSAPATNPAPAALQAGELTPRRSFNPRKKRVVGKAGARYVKNVGLGFKTPREAITGECP